MRPHFLHISAVVMPVLALWGCGGDEIPKFRIGVAQCSDDEWRRQMNEEMQREMLFHDDATLEIRSAGDSNEKQIADIRYFIDNGFDIIITAPNEAEAITPIISEAYDKGIPVIVFDRNVTGDKYTSYMEFDNVGIGAAAARYAIHLIGNQGGKIFEIRGLDGSTPAQERHKGFSSTLASNPASRTVVSVAADWNGDIAYRMADSILSLNPDIDVIYAHNDKMAIGAAKAVKEHGLGNIKIIGTDAAPVLGIQAVYDGVIDASFIYPTEGTRLIRNSMSILKGEPYVRHDRIPEHACVDSSNADILLHQNELLKDETRKIQMLKSKNDEIWSRHRTQRWLLNFAVFVSVLLVVAVAVLSWLIRQRAGYQKKLTEKNAQLEQERDKQSELYRQLDEATRSKLVFFTNVSHDLRTPLTLISEPVEQLADADYLTPSHRSMMQLARKNVKILRRLIDQILDLRRLQNGKMELNLTEIYIAPQVREWADSFRNVAAKRHMDFCVDINIDDRFSMAIDVEKVERVFFNLLSNAFKYTSDRGRISLECVLADGQLEISVADTGSGISEEDLKHIFERFYRVDKIRPRGSGIGLSLAKDFIEMQGGTLTAVSAEGKGSCFTARIPATHVGMEYTGTSLPALLTERDAEMELVPVEGEERFLDSAKPLMLVIDDNSDILELVTQILSDEYNVLTATDGAKGVKLAMKYVPDLIIADIMMPVMDGLTCCKLIKGELSTSHIPVLVLTACKLDEQRMQSYDSGADGYLSKPFRADLLRSRCRNLLDNRKRIKEVYCGALETAPDRQDDKRKELDLNDKTSHESEFYRAFLTEIEALHSDSSLTVETIASRLGLGPAQLSRKIKALTNYSPVEIIKNVRLKKARKQLVSTEKSISEIAYEVGFSSPPYFTKCFRDAYGVTPSEFRLKKTGQSL